MNKIAHRPYNFTIRKPDHPHPPPPIGSITLKLPSAAMLRDGLSELVGFGNFALAMPGLSVHSKGECRKGRKTGHNN